MSRFVSLVFALPVVLFALGSEADTVKHAELDFELTVPSGFKDFPEGKTDSETLYSFVSYGRDTLGRPIVILIDRTRERVREHKFTDTDIMLGRAFADLPPSAEMKALRGTWKEFEINVVRIRMISDGEPTTTLVAQVPLKNETILIAVAGHRGLEEKCHKVLDELLAHLEGEGGWASRAEWWSKPRNILIFGGAFALIAGFKWLARRD